MGKIGNETEPEEWTEKTESESGGETRMMTTHAGRRRSEGNAGKEFVFAIEKERLV